MVRLALVLLLSACSLVACGGPDSPAELSVLHRGNGEEPESLDVHKSSSTESGHVLRDLGEGLVGYTPQGEIRPAAAARWALSDQGRVYTFYLRPEARWSNGDPVTAQDFVFSYRRLVNPDTAALYTDTVNPVVNAREILAGEASPDTLGVAALSDYELQITLTQPVPYFLALLPHPSMFPVHPPSVMEHGDRQAREGNLVTNGAYRLAEWAIGAYVELERNEYYWDNENTSIDTVRYYVTPESTAELNRYRAGELHITNAIPPSLFAQMQKTMPDQVRVSPALGTYYFGFNMRDERLASNPKLRQALSIAVDRETVVEITARGERPAYSWVPPGTRNYESQVYSWSRMSPAERRQRAQELYREAGFGPDNPLEIEVRYNTQETHQKIAEAIQSMWRDVLGVEATLISEDFGVLLSNIMAGSTEIFRLGWSADYNDPHAFLTSMVSGHASNYIDYSNEEFDSLMQRAAAQLDPETRRRYLEEAEKVMLRDYPLIPIYVFINRSMVSPKVRGWEDNMLNYHYSQHLSLVDDE